MIVQAQHVGELVYQQLCKKKLRVWADHNLYMSQVNEWLPNKQMQMLAAWIEAQHPVQKGWLPCSVPPGPTWNSEDSLACWVNSGSREWPHYRALDTRSCDKSGQRTPVLAGRLKQGLCCSGLAGLAPGKKAFFKVGSPSWWVWVYGMNGGKFQKDIEWAQVTLGVR